MKRLLFAIFLLAMGVSVNAQSLAEKEAQAIATHLKLNAQQKQAVAKLYAVEDQKMMQDHQKKAATRRTPSNDRDARQKAAAKKKDHSASKPKVRHANARPQTSASDRLLRVAYGKSQKDPAIQAGLKDILTPAQFAEWNKFGNR